MFVPNSKTVPGSRLLILRPQRRGDGKGLSGRLFKSNTLISIIIPTLNEAQQITATLRCLSELKGSYELIVVDGGSTDGTVRLLRAWPQVRLHHSPRAERAAQMNTGADMATGDTLWFLHADTRVPVDSLLRMEQVLHRPEAVGGSFRMAFDRREWPYFLLSFFTRFNSPFWTFGDQGIFLRAEIFRELGGYADLPILEDLEFQLRLRKRGKFLKIPLAVTTSARRYHRGSPFREFFRDAGVVAGYFSGVEVRKLNIWYRGHDLGDLPR